MFRLGWVSMRDAVRWAKYSRKPIVAGRCRYSTIRASGTAESAAVLVGMGEERGEGGARDTAFASMRLESSLIMGVSWRWGKSDEDGEDQPGWEMGPHGGGFRSAGGWISGPADCVGWTAFWGVWVCGSSLLRCRGRASYATTAVSSSFSATNLRTLFST